MFVATALASRSDIEITFLRCRYVNVSNVKSVNLAPFLKHNGFRGNGTSYTHPSTMFSLCI